MTDHPFADVPRTARGHLGLLFHEAAFAVITLLRSRARAAGRDLDLVFSEYPFLTPYHDELERRLGPAEDRAGLAFALREEIQRWEAAGPPTLPLLTLAGPVFHPGAIRAFVAAGLVEEESGFGRIFSALHPETGSGRPSVASLQLLLSTEGRESPDPWQLIEPLRRSGLMDVMNPDSPRADWLLRIPSPVWVAVRGDRPDTPAPGIRFRRPEDLTGVGELIVAEPVRARIRDAAAMAKAGRLGCLVVRGMPGTDRLTVLGAVARETGRGTLTADPKLGDESRRLLGPLALLLGAVPVFQPELGPTEAYSLPKLGVALDMVGVVLGLEGGLTGVDRPLTIQLAADAPDVRRRCWARALGTRANGSVDRIAETFTVSAEAIRDCAGLAVAYADLERRETVSWSDVRQAARAFNRQQLEGLAAHLPPAGGWGQLVASAAAKAELEDLQRRCRHRERLVDVVGADFPGGFNRGVRALFEGPSGTGKTLAARVLATELGLDIYRVDLAAVVNKYVGETEKNLSMVLSRAEALDVVLLLDEGDSLLARRTEVRTANDRYANLETNYLLQRLETYQGIVIATTNLAGHVDPGFRRRMDAVVRFPVPEPVERWQLWSLHLPSGHRIDGSLLEELATRFTLTGGQIRNAVIYANLLAMASGRPLERHDVLAGLEVEYRKAGATMPLLSGSLGTERPGPISRELLEDTA
ncbi:MAG TPA: ATP-binding protein [Gemmatimonadales bacterium]|nr:ATP-binding protein [Gemmatimonadales bacterium]